MKAMDENGRALCRMQAEVFAASLNETECSSPVFLRRFMYSDVAVRMDSGMLLFEAGSVRSVFEELEEQFGESGYGKIRYGENELYWIGYLYRYWCCIYEKTSKQVYRIIKPKELRDLYYPYHSLDTAAAIDRILEAKGMREEDLIRRGVEIMRKYI